jgi:hypothetical protein
VQKFGDLQRTIVKFSDKRSNMSREPQAGKVIVPFMVLYVTNLARQNSARSGNKSSFVSLGNRQDRVLLWIEQ